MKTRLLLAAMIATGLAFAPAAFAADDMSKAGMSKDKMEKKDTHVQASDKMKKDRRHDGQEGRHVRRTACPRTR